MSKFFINGDRVDFQGAPDTPLLWVLRDSYDLTGTKFGCGMALCGACTVHVNGEATRSCVTPVSTLEGKRVTTIEGLPATAVVKAVNAAWVDKDVVQCGYCQPGQVMAATALLSKNPKPSDADIDAAMSGNICRCATYQRVKEAIKSASATLGPARPAAAPKKA
ncbi:(2Fe-2S)-binding protein [Usitatibacter palustris]|uniref:Isoquinoline 1-oxidoreductase subunit alpha n=1 Tax=Usitatibacter palustris TaxID=2732487 RepID=A0A6M4HAR8_9PROT|nr:(2Fe-2S)-binding protein [Usitatibacter palustris]QJR15753.1 Isoquinoline 1-oxidoreductase subunit alpha [Usitatibacter palustris]